MSPLVLLILATTPSLEGRWAGTHDGDPISLELVIEGDRVHGSLSLSGAPLALKGSYSEGVIRGVVEDGQFELRRRGAAAELRLLEDGETLARVSLSRSERPAASVHVNGRPLDDAAVAAIAASYGVRPKPGRYWYDPRSGLYGAEKHPAFGFMRPGHDFGPLPAHASGGRTGVFVNGRQLCAREHAVWSGLLGMPIAPGRYWLDAGGNAGHEGNPIPTVNLYANGRGRGGGGDNFWTSRFSAGNSDGDRGYVSVPGYGPVGYGF